MDYSTEESLIRGLRNRDDAAFEYLHQTCFGQILSIVKASSGNEEDAKDLYNDGIAILIHKLDKLDTKLTSKVSTLFYSICWKQNSDILKKRKTRQKYSTSEYAEGSFEEHFDEKMDRSLYRSIFRNSFQKLKENCQEVITKILEELSTERIAEDLGLSPVTVRQRKKRCQKALIGYILANPEYASLRKNNEIPFYK